MANGFWNDLPCENLAPFVCKVEAQQDGSDPSLPETTTQAGSENCGHYSHGWTEDPDTGMCYALLDSRLRWEDAKEECQYQGGWREGGNLASINSLEEQQFLTTWLAAMDANAAHWIGFSDKDKEGGYVWSDESPVAFINWRDGEPNNYGEGEDCAVIVVGEEGLWNDARCETQAQAVCEKRGWNFKPPPTPSPPVSKCQEGWIEFNDRCYYFSADTKANTWMSAETTCKNLNPISTLTSVNSQEEEDFILNAQGFTDTVFIGGSDSGSEGNWTWLDGRPWQFDHWGEDEPNGGENENCLEMVKSGWGNNTAGWWNDVQCQNMAEARSFICAYDNVLCPEDWHLYNGHCYFASDAKANFETARQMCKDTNARADLVSVHDQAEDDHIADHQVKSTFAIDSNPTLPQSKLSFLGLTYTENSWRWLDNSPLDFTNWAEGQPGERLIKHLKF